MLNHKIPHRGCFGTAGLTCMWRCITYRNAPTPSHINNTQQKEIDKEKKMTTCVAGEHYPALTLRGGWRRESRKKRKNKRERSRREGRDENVNDCVIVAAVSMAGVGCMTPNMVDRRPDQGAALSLSRQHKIRNKNIR